MGTDSLVMEGILMNADTIRRTALQASDDQLADIPNLIKLVQYNLEQLKLNQAMLSPRLRMATRYAVLSELRVLLCHANAAVLSMTRSAACPSS